MSLDMLIYLLDEYLSAGSICRQLQSFLILVGYVVTIFKIVIPLLLIVFGMLDVGKSVVAGKPDEVTKNLKSFAMRCIAAILVFFIPSIVGALMTAVAGTPSSDTVKTDDATGWRCCWAYVLNDSQDVKTKYCGTD